MGFRQWKQEGLFDSKLLLKSSLCFSKIYICIWSCFKAIVGVGLPSGSLWEGRHTHTHQPDRSQSLGAEADRSITDSLSRISGGKSGGHFAPHPALLWLMETDIRRNVREYVRRFEKVRNRSICVCAKSCDRRCFDVFSCTVCILHIPSQPNIGISYGDIMRKAVQDRCMQPYRRVCFGRFHSKKHVGWWSRLIACYLQLNQ